MKQVMFTVAAIALSVGVSAVPYYPSTSNQSNQPASYYNTAPSSQPQAAPSGHPASYNAHQKNQIQAKPAADQTVVDAAAKESNISTLLSAIQAADLNDILSRPGPYTIFAPNNEAFKRLSPETWANLMKPENKEKLKEILKNHIVPGKLVAADVKTVTLYSLDGKPLELNVNGKEISINGAKVIKADIVGNNGVIHVIDAVLVPKNQ